MNDRSKLFLFLIYSPWFLISACETAAESVIAENLSDTQTMSDPWNGFSPPPDAEYDWIQLVSGEWLKGEIKGLYNYKLEFESEELDLLKLDWKDVRQIRSADPQSIYIEQDNPDSEPVTLIGVLHMLEDRAIITSNEGQWTYHRDNIISIAEGSDNELDLWSGKLNFGANIRRGNSELVDMNTNLYTSRRTAESRYYFGYVANLSRSQNVETSNNHRLTTYYDIFSSSKFFWRPITAEYYRDKFKNIEHQLSLGSGFGYHLIRTPETEWAVLGGLGALYKRYVSVTGSREVENTSPLIVVGTRLDTEITRRIDYLFEFNFQIVDEDSGEYIHHMITTLSTDLYGDLDLDVSFAWDRVQRPQAKDDGTVPERDDFQLILGISYEF